MIATKSLTSPTFEMDPRLLKPAAVNEKIYRPVDPDDPGLVRLAEAIASRGLLEPIVVSEDAVVVSGHRRRMAAIMAGLQTVPCRCLDGVRSDDPGFLDLLVQFNSQRVKDRGELVREAIVKADPDEAYEALLDFRAREARVGTDVIEVGQRGKRKRIGRLKAAMVAAVLWIVEKHRDIWPLSDRQIHYRMLNQLVLKNVNDPKSTYRNDRSSYGDLCDLLVRLRLDGRIPMAAIHDPTRPSTQWRAHHDPQAFVAEQVEDFLKGYRRDLLQGQPCHIEVVGEKMTIEGIIRPVCARFGIPYTIGRGYSSIPARWEIVQRFRRSGKERLVLLVLSDLDPDGVAIGETLLQSLREDFGEQADAVRVGLNPEQIKRFGLVENGLEAKPSSSRYRSFVARYGTRAYELEALEPEQLRRILTEAIDSVIDRQAFNAELAAEKGDAAYLAAVREQIHQAALEIVALPIA